MLRPRKGARQDGRQRIAQGAGAAARAVRLRQIRPVQARYPLFDPGAGVSKHAFHSGGVLSRSIQRAVKMAASMREAAGALTTAWRERGRGGPPAPHPGYTSAIAARLCR